MVRAPSERRTRHGAPGAGVGAGGFCPEAIVPAVVSLWSARTAPLRSRLCCGAPSGLGLEADADRGLTPPATVVAPLRGSGPEANAPSCQRAKLEKCTRWRVPWHRWRGGGRAGG